MTSTASSVGMERAEGARNALNPPPHEAVERLKNGVALFDAMNERMAEANLSKYLNGSFRGEDVRTVLYRLRQVEEREAGWRALVDEMSDTIDLADRLIDEGHGCDTPKSWPKALQAVVKARSRTALTHSPETDGEG